MTTTVRVFVVIKIDGETETVHDVTMREDSAKVFCNAYNNTAQLFGCAARIREAELVVPLRGKSS